MKVLEAHSATLTNYEVLKFVKHAAETRYAKNTEYSNDAKSKLKGLYTIVNELTSEYLNAPTSPLSSENGSRYTDEAIPALMKRLKKYKLTKTELLMLFNLRPGDANGVENVVEEAESRFQAEDLEHIAAAVREELGIDQEQSDEAKGGVAEGAN